MNKNKRRLVYLQILRIHELMKQSAADIMSSRFEELKVKKAALLRALKEG